MWLLTQDIELHKWLVIIEMTSVTVLVGDDLDIIVYVYSCALTLSDRISITL